MRKDLSLRSKRKKTKEYVYYRQKPLSNGENIPLYEKKMNIFGYYV